jgi:DNA-binding NarL/FixJ family response regulator
MEKRMRVLLADDEPKVRSALRLILEQLKEVETIEEVTDAVGLTDQLKNSPPDLLLVDLELPGLRSGELLSDLRRYAPLKVIVLSGRYQPPQVALVSGADAFISKCDPPDRLFETLRAMGAD